MTAKLSPSLVTRLLTSAGKGITRTALLMLVLEFTVESSTPPPALWIGIVLGVGAAGGLMVGVLLAWMEARADARDGRT